MATYRTGDSSGEFSYELTYVQDEFGFTMTGLDIEHQGQKVFSKQKMAGFYKSEAVLLAQGVEVYCQ